MTTHGLTGCGKTCRYDELLCEPHTAELVRSPLHPACLLLLVQAICTCCAAVQNGIVVLTSAQVHMLVFYACTLAASTASNRQAKLEQPLAGLCCLPTPWCCFSLTYALLYLLQDHRRQTAAAARGRRTAAFVGFSRSQADRGAAAHERQRRAEAAAEESARILREEQAKDADWRAAMMQQIEEVGKAAVCK